MKKNIGMILLNGEHFGLFSDETKVYVFNAETYAFEFINYENGKVSMQERLVPKFIKEFVLEIKKSREAMN